MTRRTADTRTIRARLRTLRLRVRTLYAVHGLARVTLVAIGLAVLTYVLDRLLVLPGSVRTLLFFAATLTVLVTAVRHLLYPLRKTLGDDDLATTVEDAFPRFRDRIVSALQLARSLESDAYSESRSLAIRSIEQTLADVEPIRFRRALAPGGVQRWAAGALLCVAGGIAWATANPEYSGTWFRRMVALQDIGWPRETFLEVILPRQGRNLFIDREGEQDVLTIAAGEDLLVGVKANGKIPKRVVITYDTIASSGASARTLETRVLTKVGPRDFQYTFVGVTDSFEFFVRGGDDQSGRPVYKVRVLPPPRVDTLTLECTYPPYTGLPPATLDGASFEAPVGTRVAFRLAANLPIERAFLVNDAGDTAPLEREGEATFTGRTTVEDDAVLSFSLLGTNGLRNTRPIRYRIRAVRDLPPSLQVFGVAGVDFDATPEAVVPLRVVSADDYGVASIRVLARSGGSETESEVPLPEDAHVPAGPAADDGNLALGEATRVLTVALIDIPKLELEGARMPLEPGDILFYRVAASDTHTDPDGAPLPQTKATQPFRVHIVQRAELERKLNDWQVRLKSRIFEMTESQRDLRTEVAELIELGVGEDVLAASDAQAILDAEIDQNRLTNESIQVARDFRQIFNTYLYNRIEESPLTEKLIAALQESARRFDLEEVERYRELVGRISETERQRSDVLGKQMTMMELALSVSDELSPESTRYLTAARKSRDAGERRTLLEEARARQDRILEIFSQLLDKMQEWEDFQEVVQETKDLIELQRSVRQRTLRELEAEKEESRDDPNQK